MLAEMVFGATPIQLKSENTKLHFLPAYKQTILNKLFQVSVPSSSIAPSKPNHASQDDFLDDDSTANQATDDYSTDDEQGKNVKRDDKSKLSSVPPSMRNNGATIPRTTSLDAIDTLRMNQTVYTCKSSFGMSIIFTLYDDAVLLQQQANAQDKKSQQVSELQKLLFEQFSVIELRLRKLLKACMIAIRNHLKQGILQAQENGQISKIFHGFTFNLRLGNNLLQADQEVIRYSKEFFKFVRSFFYSPRLPVCCHQNLTWLETIGIAVKKCTTGPIANICRIFANINIHIFTVIHRPSCTVVCEIS